MPSKLLDEIVQFAGYQPAIRLCRSYGGRLLYVPAEIAETHPIALCMGYEHACEFARRYGGARLTLPAEQTALMELRNARIAEQYTAECRSISWLSREYNLTRKSVANVLDAQGIVRRALEAEDDEAREGT